MKILIIGGTIFLGKHLVKIIDNEKHDLAIFHRGNHNIELDENVEEILGDRRENLDLLKNQKWDVVIDTCGYFPEDVKKSVEYLKDKTNKYIFISTISVYKDFSEKIDESSEINYKKGKLDKEDGNNYGPFKARCEKVVQKYFKEKSVIIRPGLIVGPDDPSDRFTYWIDRISKGGKIIAPGRKDREIQFIDVRDLAKWIIKIAEKDFTGIYNAAGPDYKLRMDKFLDKITEYFENNLQFFWIEDEYLLDKKVKPWIELPLWLPDSYNMKGMMMVDSKKAISKGLKFRNVKKTIKGTYQWFQKKERELKIGLKKEKEKEIIKLYSTI
ncbi:MAG TPA: NAD-dependent epimerase/dehydratase family protein [Candidatus Mcinerneyibacterium sp.]|nr:NAD-dependent epimerase/dehydratase family protein [Candidatus Mcinerneyibacterium sp.]